MATTTEAAAQVPQVPISPRPIFGRWRFWLVWIRAKVSATKDKSLQQIQQIWAEHDKHRQDAKTPQYGTH